MHENTESPFISICNSDAIHDATAGIRFCVLYRGEPCSAFVVRVEGSAHAYLNRCAHQPVELDWNYAEFFDETGRVVVCASHGAQYDGATGQCIGGPCSGKPLVRLNVLESQGVIYWQPDEIVTVPETGIEE